MINAEILLKLANDLHNLADGIAVLGKSFQEEKPAPQEEAKQEPKVTLEEVRGVLAAKSKDGFTAEVRAIIQKYGAECLSGISEKDYPALLKDVEGLG